MLFCVIANLYGQLASPQRVSLFIISPLTPFVNTFFATFFSFCSFVTFFAVSGVFLILFAQKQNPPFPAAAKKGGKFLLIYPQVFLRRTVTTPTSPTIINSIDTPISIRRDTLAPDSVRLNVTQSIASRKEML